MHDLIIVGTGPAGVSAALTAKARGLDFLWCGSKTLSLKIEKAERIFNYPGLSAVTGREMRDTFLKQIREAGLEIQDVRIDSIYDMGGYYAACANDLILEGKTLLLAIGMSNGREIPGESKLLGKGVSYCATCDGALYKGKEIAVVCTDPSQEHEVSYLAQLARSVRFFTNYPHPHVAGDHIIHTVGLPCAINGEDKVESVTFGQETLPVDGVFCLRESVKPSVLLRGLEMDGPHIRVDRSQRTNLPGCFAAGDCTGRPYQYTKAVGEGNVAVHSALEYLQERRK